MDGGCVIEGVKAVQKDVGLEVELSGLAPEQGDGSSQLHEGREAVAPKRRPLALVDDDLLGFNFVGAVPLHALAALAVARACKMPGPAGYEGEGNYTVETDGQAVLLDVAVD